MKALFPMSSKCEMQKTINNSFSVSSDKKVVEAVGISYPIYENVGRKCDLDGSCVGD